MAQLRAVIFDVGGVLTTSPVTAIRDWAVAQGIDYGVLGPMLAHTESAWSRYEKSLLSEDEFVVACEEEARAHGIDSLDARPVPARAVIERNRQIGDREQRFGLVHRLVQLAT